MTDIEKKALALVNEVQTDRGWPLNSCLQRDKYAIDEALCRAIEQHEAFRQEVSDAVEAYLAHMSPWPDNSLRRFIIAKPDPLVEAIREMALTDATPEDADRLRAAIEKRGGKIVWGEGA